MTAREISSLNDVDWSYTKQLRFWRASDPQRPPTSKWFITSEVICFHLLFVYYMNLLLVYGESVQYTWAACYITSCWML